MKKSKNVSKNSFTKMDAHVARKQEYADLPEWTEAMFKAADYYVGGELVRRGRPRKAHPKKATNLRLDAEVLDAFRALGRGWQSRMNEVLKNWVQQQRI